MAYSNQSDVVWFPIKGVAFNRQWFNRQQHRYTEEWYVASNNFNYHRRFKRDLELPFDYPDYPFLKINFVKSLPSEVWGSKSYHHGYELLAIYPSQYVHFHQMDENHWIILRKKFGSRRSLTGWEWEYRETPQWIVTGLDGKKKIKYDIIAESYMWAYHWYYRNFLHKR